jgi:tetratricopeptide (TPR) repeat protein
MPPTPDQPGERSEQQTDEGGLEKVPTLDVAESELEEVTVAPPLDRDRAAALDDRQYFHHEATTLADRQPERAALMYVCAALAAERGDGIEAALADLEAAIALRPDSPWLLPLARRSFFRHRRYERALELGKREVALGGENSTRAAVLLESAAVVRHVKQDPRAALALVEQALALEPQSVAALLAAVSLQAELSLHAERAGCLERTAAVLTVPEERALFSFAAASIRDALLEEHEAAEAGYRAALEANPRHLPAALALAGLQERRSAWAALAGSLERIATLIGEAAIQARLLHDAGSLHLDCSGDLEAAADDLSRAAEAAPRKPAILQRLAHAHEARGRVRELVATLRRVLDLTLDAQGRAALLTQIASLHQGRLGEVEEALRAYRQALDELPAYLPALQTLSTLYRQRGELEKLLEIYTPEVEGTLPARDRALRCVEMGDILAHELRRPEQAAGCYRRALELEPGLHLAFWSLLQLLRELRRFEELDALLEKQAIRATDPRTRNHLLLERARVQANELDEPVRAARTLEGILEPERNRAVAVFRLELHSRAGQHAALAQLLLDQAAETSDRDEAQGRLLQAAGVLEFQLEEHERALGVYRKILDEDPRCAAALRGVGRIYHRLGSWAELCALHQRELANEPERVDAPILLCRIGRLLEENLGDVQGAVQAYAAALERDPACAPALPALERLTRRERRWEELVTVLQTYAAARMDRAGAADALCRAAEVAHVQLGDPGRAATLYLNAQALAPDSARVRYGLVRVLTREGSWQQVSELLAELAESAASDEERRLLALERARVGELWLGAGPQLELYQAAAGGVHGDSLAFEVTRALALTRSPRLSAWLSELGHQLKDKALAASTLLDCAHRRELGAGEGESLDPARLAHSRRPEDRAVRWCLERALHDRTRFRELGALREEEARGEVDPSVRLLRQLAAAEAYLRAGEASEAQRATEACLQLDAGCLAALRLLLQLEERAGRWRELAAVWDRVAESSSDGQNRVDACLRAAALWSEKVGDPPRAIASLARALAEYPAHAEAFARAEQLLRAGGKWSELSRIYRRRLQATRDEAELCELMRRHARLLRDDLKDTGAAVAQYSELLRIAPSDGGALAELSDLLIAQQQWSEAALKLGQLIELASDPELRHGARLKQADLYLHHLHEPRRAEETLSAALAERPEDLEARKRMVELCSIEGNWEGARQILESVAVDRDLGVQVWAVVQLAEVARLGLRDEALGLRYERDALRLVAADAVALQQLVQHYRRRHEAERLAEGIEQHLSSEPRAAGAPQLHAALAELLLDDLKQPARAIERLLSGLALEPAHQGMRLLLGRARLVKGEVAAAAHEYRTILDGDPGCAAAYRGLGTVADQAGDHPTVAATAGMLDLLGDAGPEETALLKGLEGVMSPAGRIDPRSVELAKEARALERLLGPLWVELAPLFPTVLDAELDGRHPLAVVCQRLARGFGIEELVVSFSEVEGARGGLGLPVPLLVSPHLAEAVGSGAFRFWVGRALASSLTGGALLERLSDRELCDFASAVGEGKPSTPEAQALRKLAGKLLPRKLRRQLEDAELPLRPAPWAAYRAAERDRADRIGLVLSRNPRDGIAELARVAKRADPRAILDDPRLVALMRYAVSEDYERLSAALWV